METDINALFDALATIATVSLIVALSCGFVGLLIGWLIGRDGRDCSTCLTLKEIKEGQE